MKKILLLLFFCSFGYGQTLQEVFSTYIQPSSSTQELREGIQKLETICETNPQEKCSKAKAMAYYLLADDYYDIAYNVYIVDKELANPLIYKAKELFDIGNNFMPVGELTDSQKNTLLEGKQRFEGLIKK